MEVDPKAQAETLEENEELYLLGMNNQLQFEVEQPLPPFWQHWQL